MAKNFQIVKLSRRKRDMRLWFKNRYVQRVGRLLPFDSLSRLKALKSHCNWTFAKRCLNPSDWISSKSWRSCHNVIRDLGLCLLRGKVENLARIEVEIEPCRLVIPDAWLLAKEAKRPTPNGFGRLTVVDSCCSSKSSSSSSAVLVNPDPAEAAVGNLPMPLIAYNRSCLSFQPSLTHLLIQSQLW